jgi:3-dehydroquinate synthase
MIRIPVSAPSRSYEVLLENGLLARAGKQLAKILKTRRVFVVSVPPVRRRWGKVLLKSLAEAGFEAQMLEMADGERAKRLSTLERLAERMVRLGADRGSACIALGGGVVGDVTGFLASIYMRGVDIVQVPTTVLAQVDAAIGGKTAVDLRAGKNLLGTFHQPRAVLIDPNVLTTLPSREYHAGLYESLKCGIIGNPELFRLFEVRRRELLDRDRAVLERVITDSVRLKASVVSADEREGGLRQVLNLGHTIGHALEADTGYKHLLHGEAVAWGLIAATRIAEAVKKLDGPSAQRIINAILGFGRPPGMKINAASVLRRIRSDKKTRDGVVHFILPRAIGKVEIVHDVPTKIVRAAVNEIRDMASR